MIGRANFTGRQRILQDDVELILDVTKSPLEVTVALNLDSTLPSAAEVFLEAYRMSTVQRFPLGSPSSAKESRQLKLDPVFPDSVLFRVKVVDPRAAVAVIIAGADRLRPQVSTASGRRRLSLLPVVPEELGNEVWQVRFEDDHPELVVNSRIPGIMDIVANDATFRAVVLPAVLYEILVWILLDVRFPADDAVFEHWPSRWLAFAQSLVSSEPPTEGPEIIRDWIAEVRSAFATRLRGAPTYATAKGLVLQ
ncbi:MAG: hypothetical protein ACKVT1_00315 [Dehalococcoidia bacterium]